MSIKDVQVEGSDQNWMIVEGTREGWWSWISTFLAGVIYEWPLKIILVIKIIQKHWLNTKSATKILKIFSKLYYLASRLTAFRAALYLFINSTFFSHSFIYCICICAWLFLRDQLWKLYAYPIPNLSTTSYFDIPYPSNYLVVQQLC